MKNATLSICIPAYKRPADLHRCLQSLVSQPGFSDNSVDVLVCDDGPDLPISSVVIEFQRKYTEKKIKYILNAKNLGFEKNISQCIQKAVGEWLYFLTDDDLLVQGALRKIRFLITTQPDLSFITSNYLTQYEGGKSQGAFSLFTQSQILSPTPHHQASLYSICNDLSGKCFLKTDFDLSGYYRHLGSMYPHLYAFGKMILTKKTYFETEPLFIQTIGNFTYWSYPTDYSIRALLRILEDVGKCSPQFRANVTKNMLMNVPYQLYLNMWQPRRMLALLRHLYDCHLLLKPAYWVYMAQGVLQLVKEKLRTMLRPTV